MGMMTQYMVISLLLGPTLKKPTFLLLRALFEDEISLCNRNVSLFFLP